jgi:phospholipase/carboxylesterase
VIVNFLIELWAQTGLKPANTLLVGFSQGAMMALHTGLSLDEEVAGIVAFSGALIPPKELEEGRGPKPPVAILHGDLDDVVDPNLSREAVETLTRLGFEVSSYRSPGTGHGISQDMLDFATSFILARSA